MNTFKKVNQFLKDYGMSPDEVDVHTTCNSILAEMELGLRGEESSLEMIPTYIDVPERIPAQQVIAIDAGGTNFRAAIARFTESGERSVIIASHITDDIARTADVILYLINGRKALCAPKDDLLDNWKWIHFKKGALPEKTTRSLSRVKEHMFGSEGLTNRYQNLKQELAAGMEKQDIKIKNASLDDILIALVEGDLQ